MPPHMMPIARPVTPIVVQSHSGYRNHHGDGDVSLLSLSIVLIAFFVFLVAIFFAMANPYTFYYFNRYLDWCSETERKLQKKSKD